jgi:hypothetical protein
MKTEGLTSATLYRRLDHGGKDGCVAKHAREPGRRAGKGQHSLAGFLCQDRSRLAETQDRMMCRRNVQVAKGRLEEGAVACCPS